MHLGRNSKITESQFGRREIFRGGRATSGGRCEGKYGGKLASLNVIHVGNKLADAIMLNFTKIQLTVTYLIDVFLFFPV